MTYQIENKNDLTGAMLVVRFPQEDLDEKALYTIEADQPPFLVPFRYRAVDGMAECTYCLAAAASCSTALGPMRRQTMWISGPRCSSPCWIATTGF